jgi:hypothetical protein
MQVHFVNLNGATACGLNPEAGEMGFTTLWSGVTCGPCRLEQPQTAQPGQVEYRVPENVAAKDRELAGGDRRAARKAELLAEVDAVQEKCLAEIRFWSERMAECVALREKLRGGSAPEARRKWREPQDFLDGLAGYAQRQREAVAPIIAPWHP